MVRNVMLPILSVAMALACLPIASGATLTGIVTDASGKPLEDARIEHIGKMVVVYPTALALKPSPDEVRTDADGHFRVVTDVPAIIVRKPGYQSQRIRLSGDARVKVELQQIESSSRCKLSAMPSFKTNEGNDIDYTPSDKDVWTSVEYEEIMYESGVVDASGHSADGKYWRRRGIFGVSAQYYDQNRETAEQLDCVMDRVPIKLRP